MAVFRLGDITSIQLGLILARKKADGNSPHVYKRLTLRAVENGGINTEATELFYSTEPLQDEYLTKTGTVIMKLFAPFNPVVITKETEDYLFPSQMVSIKPLVPILPEYLCLYLSQGFVAECLLANYSLIAQKAVTVDSLSNLEVKVPSLKNQEKICEYYRNYNHLCRLRKELEKEEQIMAKHIFSTLSQDKEVYGKR